jgi:hypothetical protein
LAFAFVFTVVICRVRLTWFFRDIMSPRSSTAVFGTGTKGAEERQCLKPEQRSGMKSSPPLRSESVAK